MSTIDTSTWNPDADLNTAIEGIPLNADAGIAQTWQVIRILMAAFKGDTRAIQALMVPFTGATASADGVQGFVPAPEAGDESKVLKGDGTWGTLSASDIPNIDASAITSGTIDLARLPAGALERLVTVADQTARFALTTASVQLGDTVKQLDTGLLYFVTDTAHLDSESGYEVYTAGAASAVPWSGVTDKPSTFTPSSHTHGSITNDGKLGTASRVVVTDGSKVIGVSSITTTKLGYLTDVTANIQGQIDGKADSTTTLAGYGITDAKIASGVITLGANTITPLTSASSLNAAKLTGTASVNTTGNAATATRLAGPKHSYTTAANAAKNWYRIANANTSQIDPDKPLHLQFFVRAQAQAAGVAYWQSWFVDLEVWGQYSGARIFGNTNAPFSQIRVLYENTAASVTSSTSPSVDLYLNYVLAGGTVVEIEEVYNSGFNFVADGVLAASTVPSGYESRTMQAYASGVNNCGTADFATYHYLYGYNISANTTLSSSNSNHRYRILNCTGTITLTVPSWNSSSGWFFIKNNGTGVVTVHPASTSVMFDNVSADITLQPGEFLRLACQSNNHYSIVDDGRWKSQKADDNAVVHLAGAETITGAKTFSNTISGSINGNAATASAVAWSGVTSKPTTVAGYGITDAKIANGTITLGSSSITPLTSISAISSSYIDGLFA